MAIYSNSVKDHLSQRSNTTDLINKYIKVGAYKNLIPKYVNSFRNRTIDIILF